MLEQIQKWYQEAVALHGDDWPKIECYVADKLEATSDADRTKLAAEFRALRLCRSDALN